MAKPKKAKVEVELKASSTDPKGFTWEIKSIYKNGNKLEFKNDHHPGYDVRFELDNGGTGFVFPDDPTLALAVQPYAAAEPPCPHAGETWTEFAPFAVEDDNKRLCVYNANKTKTDFKYTLFVTKDPHAANPQFEEIDPIGSNQNGPRLSSSVGIALALGGAALAFALAYSFDVFERR